MAFISPIVLGVPSTGVAAPYPYNFEMGTSPVATIPTNIAAVGDEYMNTKLGILYKLLTTQTGGRVWTVQGFVSGGLASIKTSDSNFSVPAAGVITLAQGNGTLTTSSGSTVTIALSGTYTGAYTITATTAAVLNVNSSVAGAGAGPILELYKNKATAAISDVLGELIYSGNNASNAQTTFAEEVVTATGVTASSEGANWTLKTANAGTLTSQINVLSTGCQVAGNTAAAAPTGYVGQVITTTVPAASAVTLTTTVPANIASISLTAGNWLIWGCVENVAASITSTVGQASSISATSATLGSSEGYDVMYLQFALCYDSTRNASLPVGPIVVNLASTTTYYLVAEAYFSAGTLTAFGTISAVRIA